MMSLPLSALTWCSSGGPVLTSHGTHVYLVGTHSVLGSVGGIQHWTYKVPQRRDVQSYTSRCTLCRVSVGVGGCACASAHACPREDVHTHRDGYLNCKWQLSNFEEPPNLKWKIAGVNLNHAGTDPPPFFLWLRHIHISTRFSSCVCLHHKSWVCVYFSSLKIPQTSLQLFSPEYPS